MIYVDSSVLLTAYLAQPGAEAARAVMASPEEKVSSWLLAIEVPIVLRRVLGSRPRDRALLAAALAALDAELDGIHLFDALPEVAARIRSDARFAACRTLDALHIVSAVLLGEEAGRPPVVATFDGEQRRLATACRLGTLPE